MSGQQIGYGTLTNTTSKALELMIRQLTKAERML